MLGDAYTLRIGTEYEAVLDRTLESSDHSPADS